MTKARTSSGAAAAVATAGLMVASLFACSLIDLSMLDVVGEPSDSSTFTGAVDGLAGGDVSDAECSSMCDAAQGDDEPGSASGSTSGAASGSTSGSSGSASGNAAGSTSGSMSGASGSGSTSGGSGSVSGSATGSSGGSASGSAGSTGAISDAGHKCGSNVLAPQATPQKVVASSFQNAGGVALPAAQAIDNDFSTRWGSALEVDPSWIYVDFGAPVFVGEVDFIWQAACATSYDIDISSDAKAWTPMKTIVGNNVGAQNPPLAGWAAPEVLRYPGLSGRGRYVRINGTARCLAMYGYSIWEMRALGDTDSTCAP